MKFLEAKEGGPKPSFPEENKMQGGSRKDQKLDPKGDPASLVSGSRSTGKGTSGAPNASVQKLATELKVDLTTVKGSGDNGAITEQDVRKAADQK